MVPSYPNRFLSAAAYAGFASNGSPSSSLSSPPLPRFSHESSLILFALYQQATIGPCTVPKPRSRNTFEQEKWNSWNALANMPSNEAMRLFVKILEEEDPAWLSKMQDVAAELKEPLSSATPAGVDVRTLQNGSLVKTEGKDGIMHRLAAVSIQSKWVSVEISGRKPSPRYQHASAVIGDKMYIVGGNYNGRYLNDVQILDMNNLTWSKVERKLVPSSEELEAPYSLPPCAGHSLIKWENKLLTVAGHSKHVPDTVVVHAFDIDTSSWSVLKSYGKAPVARGGQSVTLVGSNLVMFGGEDSKRRLLNDLNILDLDTMTWDAIETVGTPPSPRSDHTAAVHEGRYLLIFGGGSHSTCFNDLHILDLDSMEWSKPKTKGTLPTPRAGHAGITVGDDWYIIGGGDNKTGVSNTMALNMSTLVWSVISVEQKSVVASEGLSVVSTVNKNEVTLISFGGYNGHYINEVSVIKIKPQSNDSPSVPLLDNQPLTATVNNGLDSSQGDQSDGQGGNVTSNGDLATAVSTLEAENVKLKHDLATAETTNSELSLELRSVRAQLDEEQSRCFRLEVDLAELRQKLHSMEALQKELELLRRQKAAADKDAASAVPQQQSGGVWGWLAGTPNGKPLEA